MYYNIGCHKKKSRSISMHTPNRKHIIISIAVVFCLISTSTARRFAEPTKPAVNTRRGQVVEERSPSKFLDICSQLAPITSVLCSLAPLPTIREVSRTKSVGSLPLLPYSSMTANGVIWAMYGYLVDSPQVKWANIAGTLLGSYYFREFKKYSPIGASSLPGTMNQHIIIVSWIVLLNTFVVSKLDKETAAEIVGKEGVLMYIILFASPLAAVKNVIATKSADSIPLPFTIASTINCSLWSVVGLFLWKDFNLYFPSIMGLLCALAQLFLKGIYAGGTNSIDDSVIQEMSNKMT